MQGVHNMSSVLDGLKVLDMGHVVAVPAATATMADWGADVLKIEPLTGEFARGINLIKKENLPEELAEGLIGKLVDIDGGEFSWYVHLLNRNKKSLAVDVKTEHGREIVYKLVENTDVFLTNYEAATIDKLKMDYKTLVQHNPKLVYGLLTGYGTKGPDRNERGFDFAAAWARSGAMYMVGEPGSIPPPQRGGMMDRTVGAHIVGGIMAALYHREKTGEGQKLEFSLYHTGVWTLAEDIQPAVLGITPAKHDRTNAGNPLFNSYRTKDDRWFWLAMLRSDDSWSDFCRAVEREDLVNDERFKDMEARFWNNGELIGIIEDILSTKTLKEWEEVFTRHNCIYGTVASPMEVAHDPQALANDFFPSLHLHGTEARTVATPVKFCQKPGSVRAPAPETGQHTEEVLLGLGYSWEDIANLQEQGIIL